LTKNLVSKRNLLLILFSIIFISSLALCNTAAAADSTSNATKTNNTHILSVNGTWNTTPIDVNNTYNSIALDSSGYPHIAYLKFNSPTSTAQNTHLFYAYQDRLGWHYELVDGSRVETGRFPSIALDSAGYPHITYESLTENQVKYAYKDDSGWHIQNVMSNTYGGGDSYGTNLVLVNDQPHMSFYNYVLDKFIYAYWNGAGWTVEPIGSTATDEGKWSSLVVDSHGVPHISYYDVHLGALFYAVRLGPNNWQTSIIDGNRSNSAGLWNSLKLDSSGNPSIIYGVYDTGILRYAHWNGVSWIIEQVVNTGPVTATQVVSGKLQFDKSGHPMVVYLDPTDNYLKFAYKEGSKWYTQIINAAEKSLVYFSFCLDKYGLPHTSYLNGNRRLKYANFVPKIPTVTAGPSGTYHNSPVNVTLSKDKYGNTIYYTLDGSDPRSSPTRITYNSPIHISKEGTTTIKFAASGDYSDWSDVVTKKYILDFNAPFVNSSPVAGNYNTIVKVVLSANEIASIYYTLDGSNPLNSSTKKKYTSPLLIKKEGIVNLTYAAVDQSGNWSGVYSKTYKLSFPSNSIKVSNNGTGSVNVVYYLTATLPDGQMIYKKFSTTLNLLQSLSLNLGKYPVGTKFNWIENIYNTAVTKSAINISNQFSSSNGGLYTQKVYMTNVPVYNLVYSIEEIELTANGIKARLITPPTKEPNTQAPTVSINPVGGNYNTTKTVILTVNDPDSIAYAYYTMDGSDPKEKGIRYSSPISINKNTILRYIAVDPEGNWSRQYTQTYTLYITAPIVHTTPSGGIYNSAKTVALTASNNANIYYTIDGSDPVNGTLYKNPITINKYTTLKYAAVDPTGNWSQKYIQTYTFDTTPPTVTANPVGGTYTAAQIVTLTSGDPTAIIYCTVDGSNPRVNGIVYASPITITNNISTLKYSALDPAGNWSPIYTQIYDAGDYVIGGQNPGPSSGFPGAFISVEVEPHVLHLGDTGTIHVTISNTGSVFFSEIKVLIPWPAGLTYLSRSGGGISNIQWDTVTGIWYPGNMRPESRGQTKNLWIYFKVTDPKLEGKSLKINASFIQIKYINSNGTVIDLGGKIASAIPDEITVSSSNDGNNGGTDDGNGGDENGNGNTPVSGTGFVPYAMIPGIIITGGDIPGIGGDIIGNSPTGNSITGNNPIGIFQSPGGELGGSGDSGGGKSYEVHENSTKNKTPITTADYILGLLVVTALIAGGCIYGLKK